ncbi:helicase associated domain-containing protein [Streptomyces scopuliridis]|uniref:helicase associated domain-containing protein n=1 Tax=Streptomyces scopuliridis TaxID=452529 RepID=UPI0036BA7622
MTAARGWATEQGHLLAPLDATFQGATVGIWLKNARAAARRAVENERRRAEDLPVESSAGALSSERGEQLEEIDASWCPAWPVTWQRCFHPTRLHLDTGGTLPTTAGEIVHRGEDLGRWVRAQRLGWARLTGAQQWMCEQVLGIEPADENEKPKPRTQPGRQVGAAPRGRPAVLPTRGTPEGPAQSTWRRSPCQPAAGSGGSGGEDQEQRDLQLGAWVSNQRSRAATPTPERGTSRIAPSALGVGCGLMLPSETCNR